MQSVNYQNGMFIGLYFFIVFSKTGISYTWSNVTYPYFSLFFLYLILENHHELQKLNYFRLMLCCGGEEGGLWLNADLMLAEGGGGGAGWLPKVRCLLCHAAANGYVYMFNICLGIISKFRF